MPAHPAACTFAEPEARLPGLEPSLICPARDMADMQWLFSIADYLPGHLPAAGGTLDQPVLIMDAAEYVNAVRQHCRAKPPPS